ncbi:hypothetical protein HBB16_06215 [Pseudonocardia sp. MCCB 268]|nr:hypothetical protein [Pseudonocardia cytotoxica]
MGSTPIASFDDDYFLVGQPVAAVRSSSSPRSSPERLVTIVNRARTTVDGLRADRWFRFEARAIAGSSSRLQPEPSDNGVGYEFHPAR